MLRRLASCAVLSCLLIVVWWMSGPVGRAADNPVSSPDVKPSAAKSDKPADQPAAAAPAAQPADQPAIAAPVAKPAAPIRVLFLGDQGHHHPADRFAELQPVLAGRGIHVTYTDDVNMLDATKLAAFDALLLFANIDRLEPMQEQALLGFVENGRGLVAVHCAAYCFRNSDKFVALVGGQFARHGAGEFEVTVDAPDHPIMRGLTPFRTHDETYVHERHNPEHRTVLQSRLEGDRDEPYTWVRTQGTGRVFYTAYGHDQQTWTQPGFHALLERGIRWAAAKGDVFDSNLRPHAGLPPFKFEPAELPNYVAGKNWGAMGEPIREMQSPVSPAESQKHGVVPAGFDLELFAAEPDIGKPLAMAWDHRGRLWLAETIDYPNELQPEGAGRDRIRICEDTDGDGRADKFTVFAEQLSIPTSLLPDRDGVIVHQAPHTLFLRDTDGDGKADQREVLLNGWNTADTHAGPSNLRYGHDNWIYGMVGYAGFKGRVGGEDVDFKQGIYRFRPDGSKLEFLRNVNNNTWGLGISEDGHVFASTANGCPSVFLPIPNRYYERVRGWSSSVLQNIAPNDRYYPITSKVRQVDHHGGFTSAAGFALYTARNYPPEYWNRTAFLSDPTGHLTATFALIPHGSDFRAFNAWNLFASDDEWTAPIAAEVGPDGNVWVIDWYNYVVQHNPTPQGFKTGKGNAFETPLRDKTHGRIYRVVCRESHSPNASRNGPRSADITIRKSPPLAVDRPEGLIAALQNDNLFWRLQAQRLLIERNNKADIPPLLELLASARTDELGLCPAAWHALWTIDGLGDFSGSNAEAQSKTVAALHAALQHPSASIRRAALQVLPANPASAEAILEANSLEDRDPHVRLAALLAFSTMPASQPAAERIVAALFSSENMADRWIPDAIVSAAAQNDRAVLTLLAALPAQRTVSPKVVELAGRIAEHWARGPAEPVAPLLGRMARSPQPIAVAILDGWNKGWPKDRAIPFDEPHRQAISGLLPRLPASSQAQLIALARRGGNTAFDKFIDEFAEKLAANSLQQVRDANASTNDRLTAARTLIDFRKSQAAAPRELLPLITPKTDTEFANGLILAVAGSEAAETGDALLEALPGMTPGLRAAALRVLFQRADWTASLVKALAAGNVRLGELTLDQKQALASHPNKELALAAQKVLAQDGGLPNPDRQKVIDELSPVVLTGGDATRGKAVFKQQCAKCHSHSGEGGAIGPDLSGMAVHPKEELLIHILDPSRSVEGNFRQYTAVTDEGRIVSGLLASETKTTIELLDIEGKKHQLSRDNLDEFVPSTKSVMPEGFEKQVPPQAIADVLEFLTQRGKFLPLDLRKVATIVSTRGMFWGKDADPERLIFPDWTPKTFDGVPFLLVDPQGDRVPNVVLLNGPQGTFPPRMPKSVTLPCHSKAVAIHLLSGVSGWGYAGGNPDESVSLIVRLKYADGTVEDHPLKNGVHFADYIRVVDVPGSKLAFKLRGQQIRYLSIKPAKDAVVDSLELVKGSDSTAPVVMAVTVQTSP